MMNMSGVVFQKFAHKVQPALQNDMRSCVRPEALPTDGADTFDSADEDVRRRRQEQRAGVNASSCPATNQQQPAAPAGTPWWSGNNLLGSPGSRALFGNLARNALDQTADLAREEAPHLLDEEYHEEKDKRRANRLSASNPPLYY